MADRRWMRWVPVAVALTICAAAPVKAITGGQIDTFTSGTVQGWTEGPVSPNPPTNSTGGPDGDSDRFMRNVSSGGFGAGSNMVQFNRVQWIGNYVAAGVTSIEMDLVNLGNNALTIRIGFQSGPNGLETRFVSSPFALAADGVWRHAVFAIDEATLTRTEGTLNLMQTLSDVTEFRIFHGAANWRSPGSTVATMGADDIEAIGGTTGGGSGRVPNGADLAGAQLRLALNGGMIDMLWGASCETADSDFAIYAGTLGVPGSHQPAQCSTGGAQTAQIPIPSGDVYYLIVPNGLESEGSYGFDSNLVERPVSTAACQPQEISCQ